jgi:FkbM family methyltransferase
VTQLVEIPYDFASSEARICMDDCGGRDQVVRHVMASGWRSYESPLPLVLARLIQAGQRLGNVVFLDIGANTGFYSILAAITGAFEVRAYEPVPFIVDILKRNVEASLGVHQEQLHVHALALSNQSGSATIYMPDQGHGLVETSASLNPEFREHQSGCFEIPCQTLDAHLVDWPLPQQPVVLIKLDVETLEPQVLQGAEQMIRNHRPWIVCEILPGSDFNFYSQWMNGMGYQHYDLQPPNQVLPTTKISASLSSRDHLFLPEECAIQALLAS